MSAGGQQRAKVVRSGIAALALNWLEARDGNRLAHATGAGMPSLTDLHILVLVALAAYGSADAEKVAGWLGLSALLWKRWATSWKPRAA